MTMRAIPFLTYYGHPVSYDDGLGQAGGGGAGGGNSTITIGAMGAATVTPLFPPPFTKPIIRSSMAFASGRILAPAFNDDNMWQINFTTPSSVTRPFRFAGAEYPPSQPVHRQWAIFQLSNMTRQASGEDSPTITAVCSLSGQAWCTALLPLTSYALVIVNQSTGGGEMYMDLAL